MEQSREPRNKLMHIWPINLQQRSQEYVMGTEQSSVNTVWENWTATCKGMKPEHYLTQYTKIDDQLKCNT